MSLPHLERDDAVAFSIGNVGYLVTGNHNGFSESNRMWYFYTESGLWNEGASFPGIPRQYASAFSIGTNGYVIGGISENGTPLNDVWEFSAKNNAWTELGNFPGSARWGTSACSHDNFGYLVGGTDGQTCTNACWRFNPNSKTWDSLASFPGVGTREGVLISLSNSLVYVGGFSINPLNCHPETYIYDFDSNSWTIGTNFPLSQSSYLSGNGLFQTGYVLSGWGCDNTFSNTIWETDGLTWTLIDTLPFPGIRGMSTFSTNGCVYALTGLDGTSQKTTRLFQIGEKSSLKNLVVYPNPAYEKTYVYSPIGAEIKVHDLAGKLVVSTIASSETTKLELKPGTYIVTVTWMQNVKCNQLVVF